MLRRRVGEDLHNTLCTAWRQVVARVGKGTALAAHLEVQESHISEWGSPESGRAVPIAVVLEAEVFAGEPFVTAALAAAQGYRLVAIDAASEGAAPGPSLGILAAGVMREMGEAMTALAVAAADGRLSPRERARIAREFADVEREAGRVAAAARGGAA